MKFACLGEICAPPMRWPFSPQASSILPALSSWSGFLKTLPNVRRFVGCAALRVAFSSLTFALISSRSPGRSANSTLATTSPAASSEWRYVSPSSAGVRHAGPSAPTTSAR